MTSSWPCPIPRTSRPTTETAAIVTTLVPHIGYDASAAIAKKAQTTGRTVKEVAAEETDLSPAELDEILDPTTMTEPGLSGGVSIG